MQADTKHQVAVMRPVLNCRPGGNGRFIRAAKTSDDRRPVGYIVAVADAQEAIATIRSIADEDDVIEDLCRFSGELLTALSLLLGEFICADDVRA